ncbi:hypothetical protein BDZ97DRAFT_1922054 [Flammula alnicola]|nr:hypothetical protein BDZ97DRAFT_1922054 [Flammula alnicola]
MAILSVSEANQQLRQPPHYLAHPKQQFSTRSSHNKHPGNKPTLRPPFIRQPKPPPAAPNIQWVRPQIRPHHKDPPHKQRHVHGPQIKPHRKHPPQMALPPATTASPGHQVNALRRISQKSSRPSLR